MSLKKLISTFKAKYPYLQNENGDFPKSGAIELDNLDQACLKYDNDGNVIVENEHGTVFPVEDLSKSEMKCFIMGLENDWC